MKRIFTFALVATALLFSVSSLSAQTKFGRVNATDIITVMPERDSAQVKVEAIAAEYGEQLEAFQVEFNNKVEEYNQKINTYTDVMKQQKEKELSELNARGQEMQRAAQQDIQNMQVELLEPIYERLQAAINKVSKAQGIVMTFDVTQTAGLLYIDEANTVDITPMVKAELGL